MRDIMTANANLQDILKDTLLSLQKTNEYVVSLVAAIQEAQKAAPAPLVVPQRAPKEIMKLSEAAEYCGYSRSYMYQLVYHNAIPCHKPRGKGGRAFFKRSELDEFLSQGKCHADYEMTDKAAAILNGGVK